MDKPCHACPPIYGPGVLRMWQRKQWTHGQTIFRKHLLKVRPSFTLFCFVVILNRSPYYRGRSKLRRCGKRLDQTRLLSGRQLLCLR